VVFLAVVLPPADGAQAEGGRGVQSLASTTRAAVAGSGGVHRK
jgi:hypothetical protein